MPTPSETLHAIRGAAEVDAAALSSISAAFPAWSVEVDGWNPTFGKVMVRDQLARVLTAYGEARRQAIRLVAYATIMIDELGTGGDPDQLPSSVPWSTGELQIAFGLQGKPAAGKELGRYRVVENVTWDATISGAEADVPATAPAQVIFSVVGVPIVIFSWDAGDLDAIVDVLVPDVAPGDVIIITAPDPQDATLAGIAGTLVGRRLGT